MDFQTIKNDTKKILKGVRKVTDAPIIGCTSCEGIITPDGYISSENGFSGILSLNDKNMVVGVGIREAGKDPRAVGRRVAIDAVENAKKQIIGLRN